MKIPIFALALLLAASYAQEKMAVTKEMTEELKRTVTWKVAEYEDNIFKGWTQEEMATFLGHNMPGPISTDADESEQEPGQELKSKLELPAQFDGREKWPKCIHGIRTQGRCGSCWAHGGTEAISDRFCINGHDVDLSPQDLVSCDKNESACGGGYMVGAYNYIEETGAVTEECFPYVSGNGNVPPCPAPKCPTGKQWVKYKCKPGSVVTIRDDVEKMKVPIYTDGPVTTWHEYCEDFAYYKGGVYYYQAGRCYTGHIMKVLGWGVQDGLDYWLIANSFGTGWGEKGFVKFKMHNCGIDSLMNHCTPLI